jgi:hypothetical protein
MEILDQDIGSGAAVCADDPEKAKELIDRTSPAALACTFEKFKTTPQFDSTAQNPKWLG